MRRLVLTEIGRRDFSGYGQENQLIMQVLPASHVAEKLFGNRLLTFDGISESKKYPLLFPSPSASLLGPHLLDPSFTALNSAS